MMMRGTIWALGLTTLSGCGYLNKTVLNKGTGGPDAGPGDRTLISDPDLDERIANRGMAPKNGTDGLQLQAALSPAKSCEDVTDALRSHLLLRTRSSMNSLISYYEPAQRRGAVVNDAAGPSEAAAPASAAKASAGPTDYTTTNNQVAGIEEGDFIKNTGTHMFVARQDRVFVVKSWPAEDLSQVASVVIGDRIREMLLVEGKTLVIAGNPRLEQNPDDPTMPPGESMASAIRTAEIAPPASYPQYSWDTTALTILDVSNPSAPQIVERKHLPGSFHSFRRSGDAVRVVLSGYINSPWGLESYYGSDIYNGNPSKAEFAARLQDKYTRNKSLIMEASLAELMTTRRSRSEGGRQSSNTYVGLGQPQVDAQIADGSCKGIHLPALAPDSLRLVRLATLDLKTRGLTTTLVIAGADTVYASSQALYFAGRVWNWWSSEARKHIRKGSPLEWTTLHKFDTTSPGQADYVGSGVVSGTVLNQFSLDEHEGVLRVAATTSRATQDPPPEQDQNRWWWRPTAESVSNVTTMKSEGGQLKILGRTPDLAPGERIFSSRFDGPRGFVVTFRQVDPLFALDLSNPADPKVVSELKIPGFSNYMQFIDRDSILTIGRDANPVNGRTGGLKISLFDVSNMKAMKERHSFVISQPSWSSSNATYDHKAFTYFARTGHLAIPLSTYNWTGSYRYENNLALFHISKDSGIRATGSLNLADLSPDFNSQNVWWLPNYLEVRRSVFADDYVYAISSAGIKVARIADPGPSVGSVVLPCENCDTVGPWWCGVGASFE